MKRLLLILLLTTSVFGQFSPHQKPMLGLEIDPTHPLGNGKGGLIAAWFFNEGSGGIVNDLSGNGYGMDFVNSPVWVPGKFGSAILFDDVSSQYLELPTAIVTGYPFTMAGWFNCDDDTGNYCIMAIADVDSTNNEWRLAAFGSVGGNPIRFRSRSAAVNRDANTTTGFMIGKWHLATAVAVSATERYVYIDDGSRGSNTTSSTPTSLDNTTIGVSKRVSLANQFSGKIGVCYFYNRALSASEIAELYWKPFGMVKKDDIALLAVAAEPPPPPSGQVIMIQMSVTSVIFALIFIRIKNGNKTI